MRARFVHNLGAVDLSVIVACYNVEGYLERCLRSLRDQDMGPSEYEIIVIDDGSTDGSLDIARRHEASDPRIRVVAQANQGVSAARNAGLEHAAGKFVYFVDGDDYVSPRSLRPAVEAMRHHALELAWVGWLRVDPDEVVDERRPRPGADRSPTVITGIHFLAEDLEYPTSAWSFFVERSFLEQSGVRFEVGQLFEDQLFTIALLALARRVASLRQDVYRYVVRPGSISRNSDPQHARRLFGDLEHVIHGLEAVRERTVESGAATPAFLDRLTVMQEGYAFLLIAKIIRSRVPLRPLLPELLARLRASGSYPLRAFPGREHPGMHYRIISTAFSHGPLLYPLAYAYRSGAGVALRLSGKGRRG
jgi:glycosyltransferase involved in cell wall biosynthesis